VKYPLVQVEWVDAHQDANLITLKDFKEVFLVRFNYGLLIMDTPNSVSVAPTFWLDPETESERSQDVITIPRGMVKEITVLREADGSEQ